MTSIFKRESSINGIYGVIDVLISPILMLIITPVFLRYLGIENYAVWILVNSIVASLAIFNFAGTDLVIKFVSLARAQNDSENIKKTLSTIFSFQIFIALILYSSYLTISIYVYPDLFSGFIINASIISIAIPIFFIKQFEQLLYAFFKGYEQYKHVAFLSLVSKTLFFTIQSIVAISSNSLLDVFISALVVSILVFIMEILYLKKIHDTASLFTSISIDKARLMISFGGWNWFSSIVGILWVHSDKWMVSLLLGVKTFGFYSLGILIFNQLHNITSASVSWVFPKVSREGSGDKKNLSGYYNKLMGFIIIGSFILSLGLNNFNFIFETWLGFNTFINSKLYINLFLIMLPVYTLPIVSYYYLLGLGLTKDKFFVDVFVLISKIIALYIGIVVLELERWPLVFLVFISIQYIYYSKILCKHLYTKLYPAVLILLLQLLIVSIRIYIL